MSNRTSFVDESRERVQSAYNNAYHNVETEIQKLQKQIEGQRKDLTKRTERQLKRIRKELRGNKTIRPYVDRVESLRSDVSKELESRGKALEKRSKAFEKRIESGFENLLGSLNLASRSEVDRLDKKLKRVTKKLNALDKSMGGAPVSSKTAVAE